MKITYMTALMLMLATSSAAFATTSTVTETDGNKIITTTEDNVSHNGDLCTEVITDNVGFNVISTQYTNCHSKSSASNSTKS